MTGGEMVLIDGQCVPMRDRKLSPKELTDLEVVVGDGLEIALQGGKMKFQNSARAVLNSVKVGQALKDVQMEKLMIAADNHEQMLGSKLYATRDDDNLSNKSFNSLKKPSKEFSRSSLTNGDEKRMSSKDDLMGDLEGMEKNGEKIDGAAENLDADKLDTATADVIIGEYPADCLPDGCYKYFPMCLEETPFWLNWKELRNKSYQLVEHKYFETLVITLILISSMALVCNFLFWLIYFITTGFTYDCARLIFTPGTRGCQFAEGPISHGMLIVYGQVLYRNFSL